MSRFESGIPYVIKYIKGGVKAMAVAVIDIVNTGKNIRALRKKAGISVCELQDIMGFNNPQAIYKWERGETLPTIDNLVILATNLNVRVDDILVLTETIVSISA